MDERSFYIKNLRNIIARKIIWNRAQWKIRGVMGNTRRCLFFKWMFFTLCLLMFVCSSDLLGNASMGVVNLVKNSFMNVFLLMNIFIRMTGKITSICLQKYKVHLQWIKYNNLKIIKNYANSLSINYVVKVKVKQIKVTSIELTAQSRVFFVILLGHHRIPLIKIQIKGQFFLAVFLMFIFFIS